MGEGGFKSRCWGFLWLETWNMCSVLIGWCLNLVLGVGESSTHANDSSVGYCCCIFS